MLACVCVAIAALALRTVQVQVLDGGALARAAESQQRVTVPLWAPRGPIVDRTGQMLAISFRAVTVGAWPSRMRSHARSRRRSRSTPRSPRRRSSSAWGAARSTCSSRAASTRRPGRASRPIRCSARSSSRGRSSREQEPRRIYPNGGLAAQVVGSDGAGLSGVELSRNDVLSARHGLASVSKVNDRPTGDAHWARVLHVREPRPGKTVQLTLDTRIQRLVQQAIAARRARWHAKAVTAVVLDTHTGGILAMAAAPGVPPQGYRAGKPDGMAPARDHRPLRARLDVQARDLHGRAPGGRDHAEHAVPRARHVHEDLRPAPAHDRGRAPARARALDRARDPRALLERRHDHDRRAAPGPDGGCRSGSTARLRQAHRRRPARASGAARAARRQVVRHRRSSTSRSARASRSRRCRWPRCTPRSPTAASGSSRTSRPPSAASRSPSWSTRQLVSPHVARELRGMLTDVVDDGTGTLAQIPGYSVAGKTGTTPKFDAKHGSYCDPYGPLRVPDVVRRLRARQASALRRARDGRRAAVEEPVRHRGRLRRGARLQEHRPGHPAGARRSSPIVPGELWATPAS